MLDEILRPLKDRVLAPLTAAVGRRLQPNTITLVAFLFGVLSAVMAAMGWYIVGLILWIANRVFDGLDGAVARAFGSQSDLGGYLDILLDFTVYAAVPAAFALSLDTRSVYLALVLLLSMFYINGASWMYLSALLEKRKDGGGTADGEASGQSAARGRRNGPGSRRQTSIRMPGGLIGGTETIIFYTLFFLLPGRIVLLFAAMALFTAITVVQRMVWAVLHIGTDYVTGKNKS